MSSGSDSESSGSPARGPAPTPGHGLDRSASNSPSYDRSKVFRNRSRSASPAGSQKSVRSVVRSQRSGSGGSGRSDSPDSKRSGSAASKRSSSPTSQRSGSAASNRSGSKSRSASPDSNRSASRASNKSASRASDRSRSGSPDSKKSGRRSAASNRSQSGSVASSRRSRSGSEASNKSGSHRSRSGSAASVKSGSQRSRSVTPASNKSRSHRSRSGSAVSNRSRSGSAGSDKLGSHRSRSGSEGSRKSGSRSRSRSESAGSKRSRSGSGSPRRSRSRSGSKDRSGSNSPILQIDEGEHGEKRKRDSSEEREKKKPKALVSDSENEGGAEAEKVAAADIFGDADDISSEEERDKAGSDKEEERRSHSEDGRQSEEETERRPAIEEDEDKNEPEVIPETRIDVEVPKITCDLGRDIHFVKLPNFLSVETRPYDPETYEDEIDEEETLDEEGRARLKLKVENTIRWREILDNEGNMKKESNARIVKWSDGSYSLHLGAEIFDVYKQPLQGDHNHLFIRQGTGLQGQAVFRTKLSFRPHSTESFTHRKMTLSLADRSTKTTGIKIMSQVGVDPDLDKATRLKKEEEKLRQHPVRPKTSRKKADNITRGHAANYSREEDGSDDEGAISLNAIKNTYKRGSGAAVNKGAAIYSSDEEDSDIENSRAKRHSNKMSDSEEEDASD